MRRQGREHTPIETLIVATAALAIATAFCLLAAGCSTHSEPPGHGSGGLTLFSSHSDYAVKKAKDQYRKQHPRCVVCNAKSNISNGNRNDVHHKLPVSRRPDLAATPSNLITMCRRHHFWVGHAGSWRSYNTNLVGSVRSLREAAKTIQRP